MVVVTLLALLLLAVQSTSISFSDSHIPAKMMGGIGSEREADADVQKIVDGVKPAVEESTGQSYDEFTCVKFTTQVVAGTNYFVKVKVGEGSYIHLRIFVPLPHTQKPPQLVQVQEGKAETDPISYF